MGRMTAMTQTESANVDSLFDPEENKLFPKYLLDEARINYVDAHGRTVWDYYNSLTYAITHKSKSENPDMAIQYGMRALRLSENLLG